jgi:hypothetical protein
VRGLAGASDVVLTTDDRFVLVTGEVGNTVAVFQRDTATGRIQFVQLLRNNVGGVAGLLAPSSLVVDPAGDRILVGSLGQTGAVGGLVTFDNVTLGIDIPEPTQLHTAFDGIEQLGVSTAGGQDTISLLHAPEPQITTTTITTGDSSDSVVLLDLSPQTFVNLGEGDDTVQLRSITANTNVQIHGEGGADTIDLQRVGESTSTEVFGGPGPDIVSVLGGQLPASATTIVHGDDPTTSPGDTLVFDPQDPTPNDGTPNYTPAPPIAGQGSVQVLNQGVLQYDTFEGDVVVIAAPVIDFAGTPYAIQEGQALTLTADVAALGSTNQLAGPVLWDLDGDGQFGEVQGDMVTLTWEQLVDFGISDDGTFQVGASATNEDGYSTTAFTTLTVSNKSPTVDVQGAAEVFVNEPYMISFTATDPGADRVSEWRVDWGDGGPIQVFGSGTMGAVHEYAGDGHFDVWVGAVDEDSAPNATFADEPLRVEVKVQPKLTVDAVLVNGGDVQRSNIETIDIRLVDSADMPDVQALIESGQITSVVRIFLAGSQTPLALDAAAFRWDSATHTLRVDVTTDGFGNDRSTRLSDGVYQLQLDQVFEDTDGLLDGTYRYDFHRLLGDLDGDRDVDVSDRNLYFLRIGQQEGDAGYDFAYDFNKDGIIDRYDYVIFRAQYGKHL